ncbi:phospho-sugar mutase [Corynebacterium argentoratense]|uniref:phospho-sugar mutase n=1 Tax=Corynebacterium argentoratense TaxID=42817 RepID=UPI0028EA840F|nr:phospho-sugar mutase [Corynebacterium argentoratense]
MNINDQQPVTEGLRFGTAGLRAPVGPGAQEMNVTQVTRTTAGVASWLAERAAARAASGAQQHHPDPDTEALLGEIHGNIDDGALKVAVGFDARYGSHTFAVTAAEVFAGAGFEVTLLPTPTPTPVLAWLVKYRGLDAGVQITASHNPASDNGYKVYVDGGSQLISPDDREIEKHIARISLDDVANIPRVTVRPAPDQLLHYLDAVVSLVEPASSDRLRVNNERADLKVAYTALHGVGGRALKQALQWAGFAMTWSVASQHYPDPTFPTVDFPNPEEAGATDQLIELGQQVDADILVALDPDADRCAIGIRTEDTDGHSGRRHFRMLRGDELGPLLATRIVDTRMATTRKAFGTVAAPVVATTVVSSQLLGNIATQRGWDYQETLTGFKHLARAATGRPGELVFAYEEAIGTCPAPWMVADKDGIATALVACSWAAELKAQGSTLEEQLEALYQQHGYFQGTQISVRTPNPRDVITQLENTCPDTLAGMPLAIGSLPENQGLTLTATQAGDGSQHTGAIPAVRIIGRASGTEPKAKFYIETHAHTHAQAQQLLQLAERFVQQHVS